MNIKILIGILLLAFAGISLLYLVINGENTPDASNPNETVSDQTDVKSDHITAYYFHGFKRCKTCLEIESLANEVIETGFPDELLNGSLELQAINFEEETNSHFVDDYELIYSSLVLVEYKNGEQVRWKNLEKVWDYVWDQENFINYVQSEIKEFLYDQDSPISKLDN